MKHERLTMECDVCKRRQEFDRKFQVAYSGHWHKLTLESRGIHTKVEVLDLCCACRDGVRRSIGRPGEDESDPTLVRSPVYRMPS